MQFLASNTVDNLLRGLWASLCQLIYRILAWLYELFMNISRVEILTTDNIEPIYQRITMILTIIMVFYVTFEAVKYVVQPDNFTDKEKGGGKLTLKMILVVILIAFVPSFFSCAYKFQNVIFDNQVFSKIILGKQSVDTDKFGRIFSANVLGMFYYADESTWSEAELDDENNCDGISCKDVVSANLSNLVTYGELNLMQVGLNDGDKVLEEGTGKVFKYYIHFDGLFAVLVGAFICYVLILYCIDVGVRVIQLTFLQIIAPIPIIGYLSPKKDGIFQKWVKQCTTTYLDLFIRTGIIYFGLLICQILSVAFEEETLFNNIPGDTTTTMKVFIYIALIMGLLMFMQKAPKMLGELFPKMGAASGNFGLKAGERMAPIAARAAGAALGSTRAIGGAVSRGVKAAMRNRDNGYSLFTKRGRANIAKAAKDRADIRSNYADAKKEYRAAKKQWNNTLANTKAGQAAEENLEAKKKALDEKRNAYAKSKNESYRNVATTAAWGGVKGAWYGATTGAKATKLEDIPKQVKAGYKKDSDNIKAYEQYLDAGGAGGITGAIDRGITRVGESIGIPSRSAQLEQEMKRYETKINTEKQRVAIEEQPKKSLDGAVDANLSKIEDGKHKGEVTNDKLDTAVQELAKDLGLSVDEVAGKKLVDLSRALTVDAETKNTTAEELEKKAAANPSNLTLAADARKAREAAKIAKENIKKGNKSISEYENTRILQDIKKNINVSDPNLTYEQGAVVNIKNAIDNVKSAYQDPDTRQKVIEYINTYYSHDIPLRDKLIDGFTNANNISDNSTLDKLGKALGAVAAERSGQIQIFENNKNRLSTGEYKKEVAANVTYGGNSGNSGK